MPTIKLELFKSKTLSDGRHPICIRVTHKGKQKRKMISSAHENEWDAKYKPHPRLKLRSRKDAEKVNQDLEDEFAKYLDRFKELDRSGDEWDAEDVFKTIERRSELFLENSLRYLEYIRKVKSKFTLNSYTSIHGKINEYVKGKDFQIDSITQRWMEGYHKHCILNSSNTFMGNLKYIKRIAKRSGIENKFLSDSQLSFTKPIKQKLTAEELVNFASVKLTPGTHIFHAQQTFMLQYYLRGMRIGDIITLKHSNIIDGKLIYSTGKTSVDHEIKLRPEALSIIELYKDGEYILPWIRWKPNPNLTKGENQHDLTDEIKNRTSVINYHLKRVAKKAGITKNVSTHIARHTLASIADKKLGGNLKPIQGLLGHGSRRMTEIYINELRQSDELDDAADKIYD